MSESLRIHPSRFSLADRHAVLDAPLTPPFADEARTVLFGLGCFWGAEKAFWQQPAVLTTAVGYAGGTTTNPDYRTVCGGNTGHAEVVLVVFAGDDSVFSQLLEVFWESHNPTQGMRQGNDIGSQYRSMVCVDNELDLALAVQSRDRYQAALSRNGYGAITTEIRLGADFWYAEDYHQQYLVKNPAGYCGLGGTGIAAR